MELPHIKVTKIHHMFLKYLKVLLVTRHGQFFPAINVINVYGSQERRTEKGTLDNNWGEILNEIRILKIRVS